MSQSEDDVKKDNQIPKNLVDNEQEFFFNGNFSKAGPKYIFGGESLKIYFLFLLFILFACRDKNSSRV